MFKRSSTQEPAPLLYSVEDSARMLGVGRGTIYKMMDGIIDGSVLESIKIGNRRLVRAESIHALANKVEEDA